MPRTDNEIRSGWDQYRCRENEMVVIPFGPDRIRVAPPTAAAWDALASVMAHHGYAIRTLDTDSYNCRKMKNSTKHSLHGYGIALDVNWQTNPYLSTGNRRKVRFSDKATQAERAEDVRLGLADTDMTQAMIADIEAVRTLGGVPVFEWGGRWSSIKDAMHFQIDVLPAELAAGIDPASVAGGLAGPAPVPQSAPAPVPAPTPAPAPAAVALTHMVIARSGLNLRGGPGTNFEVRRLLPVHTRMGILAREGDWAQVDLEGDGLADGFVSASFLRAVEGAAAVVVEAPAIVTPRADILDRLSPDIVGRMFPAATSRRAIETYLPHVISGLRNFNLTDQPMALMALATIRAETEGFVPISEGVSRYNTDVTPFDRYDAGTRIGANLGNTQRGDGARFKGRGFVQLTGRDNYTRIGRDLGVDLVGNPDAANAPDIAGRILAAFLYRVEARTRTALAARDLAAARRAVNGGSHGLDRFVDTFTRGEQLL